MKEIQELHPRWITKKEMAKRLNVAPRTVYGRHKRGQILRKEENGVVLWALPEGVIPYEDHSTSTAPTKPEEASDPSGSDRFRGNDPLRILMDQRDELLEKNGQLTRELIDANEQIKTLNDRLNQPQNKSIRLAVVNLFAVIVMRLKMWAES